MELTTILIIALVTSLIAVVYLSCELLKANDELLENVTKEYLYLKEIKQHKDFIERLTKIVDRNDL